MRNKLGGRERSVVLCRLARFQARKGGGEAGAGGVRGSQEAFAFLRGRRQSVFLGYRESISGERRRKVGEELAMAPVLEGQGLGARHPLVWARPQAWPSLLALRCHGCGSLFCWMDLPECPLWSFGCWGAAGTWAVSLASASG